VDVPQSNGASFIAAQSSVTNYNSVSRYVTVNGLTSGLTESGSSNNVYGASNPTSGFPIDRPTGFVQQGNNTAQTPVASAPPLEEPFKATFP